MFTFFQMFAPSQICAFFQMFAPSQISAHSQMFAPSQISAHSQMFALAQIWTFLLKIAPSLITTFGPITQLSGTATEGSICAEGSTFAVGWILIILKPPLSRVALRLSEVTFFVFTISFSMFPVSEVSGLRVHSWCSAQEVCSFILIFYKKIKKNKTNIQIQNWMSSKLLE